LVQRFLSYVTCHSQTAQHDFASGEEDFGDPIGSKADGVVRLAYGNINGFHTAADHNPKAHELRRVIQSLDIDYYTGVEANINWTTMPRHGQLAEWFRSENALRTSASHNIHEQFGRRQHGGTFALAFGTLAHRVIETGTDSRGLGRYNWMLLRGRAGHRARLLTVYVPCRSSRRGQSTVMAQQHRHFLQHGDTRCPRQILLDDLSALLLTWRQNGERLLVFIDANEDVRRGPFHSLLTGPGLYMRDLTFFRHGSLPVTHRRGRNPIDACFATPDISADAATFRAFFSSPGDHRMGVWDIQASLLIGEDVHHIVRPTARRLACSVPTAISRYNKLLESHLRRHRVLPQLYSIYQHQSGPLSPTHIARLETLDRVTTEGMLYAEKRCRKLAMGNIPYCPAVALARRRRYFYKCILDHHQGTRRFKHTWLSREAKSLGIFHSPLCVSLDQAQRDYEEADQAWVLLKKQDPITLRRDFLQERATNSAGQHTKQAQNAAQQIIRHEKTREDF
jgi:hypothetical protein